MSTAPVPNDALHKHYPALDGLRGIAALIVVAHHAAFSYVLTNWFDKAYFRLSSPLWIGVDLFFVLSGFLITGILLASEESPRYFSTFYGRRILRIFPLYYIFLIGLYIGTPLLGGTLTPGIRESEIYQWLYASNIYIGFHGWPDPHINHLWTLAIEEQFYLIWPFIVFALPERVLVKAVPILLLLLPVLRRTCVALGFSPYFVYTFTLCKMDGLLWGALLSLWLRSGRFSRVESRFKLADVLYVAGLLLWYGYYMLLERNDTFQMNFLTWSQWQISIFPTIIAAVVAYPVLRGITGGAGPLRRVAMLPVLRSAGKYSYALYLLHMPICLTLGFWLSGSGLLPHGFLGSVLNIALQFAASIAAAVLSWNLIEKHFLKLKRYFVYG